MPFVDLDIYNQTMSGFDAVAGWERVMDVTLSLLADANPILKKQSRMGGSKESASSATDKTGSSAKSANSNAFVDTLNNIATGTSPSRFSPSTINRGENVGMNGVSPARMSPLYAKSQRYFANSSMNTHDLNDTNATGQMQMQMQTPRNQTTKTAPSSVSYDSQFSKDRHSHQPSAPYSESKKTPYAHLKPEYSEFVHSLANRDGSPTRGNTTHSALHDISRVTYDANQPKERSKLGSSSSPYGSGDPLDVSFFRTPVPQSSPSMSYLSTSRSTPSYKTLSRSRPQFSDRLYEEYRQAKRREMRHKTRPDSSKRGKQKATKTSQWLDPSVPEAVEGYVRVAFNIAIIGLLVWFVYTFITSIRQDIDQRVEVYSTEILAEIDMCTQQYLANKCMDHRPPALEPLCANWERCMEQDPRVVGRARVSAETFGDIINSFLKPIGLKAMIFLTIVFVGSLVTVNFVFAYRPHAKALSGSEVESESENRTTIITNKQNLGSPRGINSSPRSPSIIPGTPVSETHDQLGSHPARPITSTPFTASRRRESR